MRRILALLLVAALAGCAGEPSPEADAQPAPSESATTSSTPAPAAAPQPMANPVQWSGHTKEGAWVCSDQSGTSQCPAGQQVAPDGAHVALLQYAGNVSAVELTLAWQADPTQGGLVFAVYGNQTGGRTLLASAQGASPLSLVLAGSDLDVVPDNALVLMVWPQGRTPTSPSVFVDATQQPFSVDGVLWTVP